jgi:hypothetical protein
MKKKGIHKKYNFAAIVIVIVLTLASIVHAGVALAWDPSPDPNAVGYILYYGPANAPYSEFIDAGANTTVTMNNLVDGETYYFAVAAYDAIGDQSFLSNQIEDAIPFTLPIFFRQTPAQSLAAGSTAEFYVDVLGDPPLTFQWYNGDTPIPGATNSSLILPGVSGASAGNYTVQVSNPAGTVTSANMVLSVLGPITSTAGLAVTSPVTTPVLYSAAAGEYIGLFTLVDTNGAPTGNVQTSGLLSGLDLSTNGSYIASVLLGGITYPFSGVMDSSGNSTLTISRALDHLPDLALALTLASGGDNWQLTGTLSNTDPADPWMAPLTAVLTASAELPRFDLLLPLESLPGVGIIDGVNQDGLFCLTGLLPDNTRFRKRTPLGTDGSFPLFVPLYQNVGLLEGWIRFSDGIASGTLTWSGPTADGAGFTNVIEVISTALESN